MPVKAVMISIRPEWCSLIAQGKKTVEVRKTRPEMGTPFKCYIYESQGNERVGNENFNVYLKGSGRKAVIGEFVCNSIVYLGNISTDPWEHLLGDLHEWKKQLVTQCACLTEDALHWYGGKFAWFISNLVIYDKPKKINDFKRWNRTEDNTPCAHIPRAFEPCETCTACNLKRPPQSWCYVVEG